MNRYHTPLLALLSCRNAIPALRPRRIPARVSETHPDQAGCFARGAGHDPRLAQRACLRRTHRHTTSRRPRIDPRRRSDRWPRHRSCGADDRTHPSHDAARDRDRALAGDRAPALSAGGGEGDRHWLGTDAVLAGIVATAAVGSFALAVVLSLGRGAALALFLFMAVAGTIPPERLVDLARPGMARLAAASAMELGPALWHYRDIAAGDVSAVLHALAWTGLGILLSSAAIARRRTAAP